MITHTFETVEYFLMGNQTQNRVCTEGIQRIGDTINFKCTASKFMYKLVSICIIHNIYVHFFGLFFFGCAWVRVRVRVTTICARYVEHMD